MTTATRIFLGFGLLMLSSVMPTSSIPSSGISPSVIPSLLICLFFIRPFFLPFALSQSKTGQADRFPAGDDRRGEEENELGLRHSVVSGPEEGSQDGDLPQQRELFLRVDLLIFHQSGDDERGAVLDHHGGLGAGGIDDGDIVARRSGEETAHRADLRLDLHAEKPLFVMVGSTLSWRPTSTKVTCSAVVEALAV